MISIKDTKPIVTKSNAVGSKYYWSVRVYLSPFPLFFAGPLGVGGVEDYDFPAFIISHCFIACLACRKISDLVTSNFSPNVKIVAQCQSSMFVLQSFRFNVSISSLHGLAVHFNVHQEDV